MSKYRWVLVLTTLCLLAGCQAFKSMGEKASSAASKSGQAARSVTAPIVTPLHMISDPIVEVGQLIASPVTNAVGSGIDKTRARMKSRRGSVTEKKADEQGALIAASDAYRLGYSVRWSADLKVPARKRILHAVVLDDVIACVESSGNMASCLNARDGTIRWQEILAPPSDRLFEPVRYEDQMLINTETHIQHHSIKTGEIEQRHELAEAVVDRPVLVGSDALFGGINGKVFAHSLHRGYQRWAYGMTSGVMVRPVAENINVFVCDSNGVYAMLQTTTGEVIWKGVTFGAITAAPAISGVGAFVASQDRTLYALNRSTGKDRWKYRAAVPLNHSPIIIENTLYLLERGKGLVALDALTGRELWVIEDGPRPITLRNDRLILHAEGRLLAVDPATGVQITAAPIKPLHRVLVGPDNSLILVSPFGKMMRLDSLR